MQHGHAAVGAQPWCPTWWCPTCFLAKLDSKSECRLPCGTSKGKCHKKMQKKCSLIAYGKCVTFVLLFLFYFRQGLRTESCNPDIAIKTPSNFKQTVSCNHSTNIHSSNVFNPQQSNWSWSVKSTNRLNSNPIGSTGTCSPTNGRLLRSWMLALRSRRRPRPPFWFAAFPCMRFLFGTVYWATTACQVPYMFTFLNNDTVAAVINSKHFCTKNMS